VIKRTLFHMPSEHLRRMSCEVCYDRAVHAYWEDNGEYGGQRLVLLHLRCATHFPGILVCPECPLLTNAAVKL